MSSEMHARNSRINRALARSVRLLPVFLLLLFAGTVAAEGYKESPAARTALESELTKSEHFSQETLASLSQGQRKDLEKGKPVALLEDIPGTPVKIGKGIGIIDYPPEVVYQVVGDFGNYKAFMPFTKESEVDEKRSGGDVVYFSSRLDLPFIDDRYYTLKFTNEENVDGTPRTYFLLWSLDTEKKSNLYLNSGSWKLVPYGLDGKQTLAFYTVITDPGGSIPNFIKNKSTKIGIPSVFDAISKRAAEGLQAGIYRLPVPEDRLARLLRKELEKTRRYEVSTLESLSDGDREKVLKGEIFLDMGDVRGTWVKLARSIVLLDVPSSKMWEVLTHYDGYQEFIPYVAESRKVAERSRGNVAYVAYRLHFVIFPFIKDRYYTLKLTEEESMGGKEGEDFLQWTLDQTKPSNINESVGSWKLVPYGSEGEKTLVFYTIMADPGGVSPWFWKNLSAKTAVKKVLKAIAAEAGAEIGKK